MTYIVLVKRARISTMAVSRVHSHAHDIEFLSIISKNDGISRYIRK